jgi:hypothetical protein
MSLHDDLRQGAFRWPGRAAGRPGRVIAHQRGQRCEYPVPADRDGPTMTRGSRSDPAGHEAIAGGPANPGRLPRCVAAASRVTKAPPLDTRDRRYRPYLIVTCALPAAAAFVVVTWRPPWAWWGLAAELTAITVLTAAWRVLRAVKGRATAAMATAEDVTSAEEQERRDTGMPGERPDGYATA